RIGRYRRRDADADDRSHDRYPDEIAPCCPHQIMLLPHGEDDRPATVGRFQGVVVSLPGYWVVSRSRRRDVAARLPGCHLGRARLLIQWALQFPDPARLAIPALVPPRVWDSPTSSRCVLVGPDRRGGGGGKKVGPQAASRRGRGAHHT